MAVKKKAEEATNATEAAGTEKEEKTVNNTAEQEKAENGANDEATEGQETEQEETEKEEVVKLAYIGPTLPAGQLKCNKIFIGTETEIKKELEAVLEKYPLVEKMLVPASQIGEKKDKAKTAGNILHKYYADIVSSIAGNAAKEG
ncbi:MAG: hypothetical protein OSJ42_07360 [Bacteroidales bacterium]|nr:hypothetical protein [Bacteroidales bacterium]